MAIETSALRVDADVLVIGGGPAGAWAALAAKAGGVERVVLADKGSCGTSGATASANTGLWYMPPDAPGRQKSIETRFAQSGGLARKDVMEEVLNTTFRQMARLEAWGYPFPREDNGVLYRSNLRGPDYMAFLRRQLKRAGVTLLDHSPTQELLISGGEVVGAAGYRLQQEQDYRVHAPAVVLASGGVAFLSKTLGCDVNTGDGLLMAVEAGAELSGMEFSAQYGICPAYSTVTKGLPYAWATFTDEAGHPIPRDPDRMLAVGRALLKGPVYAVLDKADADAQRWLRAGQPNCFLPHDRLGINPFTQRFPVILRCEGTVRGTGGIRLVDDRGGTGIPGLYAAGDAASRECLTGSASGGGAPNAAWAISSGTWAGRAAAEYALSAPAALGSRDVRGAGTAGLRPTGAGGVGGVGGVTAKELILAVQAEMLPLDKNLFRTAEKLTASLAGLDAAWRAARAHLHGTGQAGVRAREAAALIASARYAYRSALARGESRGLHRRIDLPETDPAQTHHLAASGLDEISIRAYSHSPVETTL